MLIEMGGPDWANLAPELVAYVMERVQMGHSERGEGRRIVAFAGVCRRWRKIVQQEWKTPINLLHFPCSLRTPGPSVTPLQCMLTKNRNTITMYQGGFGDEYFVLAARKKFRALQSCYVISSDPRNFSTKGRCCEAIMLSDFWRNHFVFRDVVGVSANGKSTPTLLVDFKEIRAYGVRYRHLGCRMLISAGRSKLEKTTRPQHGSQTVASAKESFMTWSCLAIPSSQVSHACDEVHDEGEGKLGEDGHEALGESAQVASDQYLSLHSKAPVWNPQQRQWSLDFGDRATLCSIHNFQLLSRNRKKILLQLGKVGDKLYTLDYRAPLSAVEAFSICVSSFATYAGVEP